MKIKYDVITHDVICIGEMPELSGQGVAEGDFTIPNEQVNYYTFNGVQLVRKSEEDIENIIANESFSFHILMGYLNQNLSSASIISLSPYTGALQSFCDWKNWAGITAFLSALVSSEIMTESDRAIIVTAFSEQGISV